MRNVTAPLDDKFGFDVPARAARPSRKARPAGKRKSVRAKTGTIVTRYAHYAAIGLSGAVAIGIMVNALVMQQERHPAPLFGKAIPLGDMPPAPVVARVPTPDPTKSVEPSKRMEAADPTSPPDAVPESAVAPMPVPRAKHSSPTPIAPATKPATAGDPIATLLKNTSPASASEKDTGRSVTATQKALMKLGYVVKPDGNFGATTKHAIELFERDQHLPIKGEMSRKLLKQLSAESGVAID